MTVVVYSCDTCKREVYRKQNKQGIDVIGRCIITNGCKGKLQQKEVKPSYAIGHSTAPVVGLADWEPRKILYTYTQSLAKKQWTIQHNLNGLPIIDAYMYDINGTFKLNPITPVDVQYTNNNTVTLSFSTAITGIAQLQMRSSVADQTITSLKPVSLAASYDADRFVPSESKFLTNGAESYGELTIATRVESAIISGFDPYQEIVLKPYYLSPTTNAIVPVNTTLTFRTVDALPVDTAVSPWAGVTKVVVSGAQYVVRSANIHSAKGTLNDLGVPEGAPVFFSVEHKGQEHFLQKGEMLGLLANDPFLTVDRVYNQYVDMAAISQATAPRQIVYSNYNWHINQSLLTKTYPNIITL